MAKRICGAGFIAILGIGLMVAPAVWAGSGAFGGHHGGTPAGLRAPIGKTVAHPRAVHAFRGAARLHNHRAGHRRLGLWNTGWYGGYYDPANYTMLHDRPAYSEPAALPYGSIYTGGPYPAPIAAPVQKPVDVIVYRPGCDSHTQIIPWSDGKDRAITMVRC
jgi:hypothetical protein